MKHIMFLMMFYLWKVYVKIYQILHTFKISKKLVENPVFIDKDTDTSSMLVAYLL